jgi:hypothetical protein
VLATSCLLWALLLVTRLVAVRSSFARPSAHVLITRVRVVALSGSSPSITSRLGFSLATGRPSTGPFTGLHRSGAAGRLGAGGIDVAR